jgi:hypothetical protein
MGLLDRLLGSIRSRLPASPPRGEAASHGDPEAHPAELRAETWDRPDGARVHLLVVAARGATAVHAFVRDPSGASFRAGSEIFEAAGIDACGDALVGAMALFPVDRRDVARLRLVPPDTDRMVRDVAALADMLANNPLLRGSVRTRAPRGPTPLPPRHPSGLVDVVEGSDIQGLHVLGHDARTALPAPAATTERTVTVLDPCTFPPGRMGDENRAVVAEVVGPWHDALRASVLPAERPWMTPEAWTPESFAHYAVPGEAGKRRAQAAALHPGLSPVLAHVPALRALVDAGRPFEEALALTLAGLCDRALPPEAARMRRLRTLARPPAATGPGGLAELVDVACGLPLDRIPLDAAGWDRLLPHVGVILLRVSRRNGLDLATLLRGLAPGFAVGDLMPPRDGFAKDPVDAFAAAAVGVDDMVANAVLDLVRPCIGARPDEAALAGRLLLGGRTMAGAVEAQAAWHAWAQVLTRDESETRRPNLTWPALFQPYRHDSGVVVRCLTSSSELIAEGGTGADADGIRGLSHCVRTYDRSCVTGAMHVASVRVEERETTRISTVEIRVEDIEDRRLRASQHRAAHNAIPPLLAEAAVQALFRDVAEGLHPIDPVAARPRAEPPRREGAFDAAATFEEWRPLMTRTAARAGLPALMALAAERAPG